MVSYIRKQRTSVETVWPTRTTDRNLHVHDARFIGFCRLTGRNDRMNVAACTYDNCRRWRFTTVRTIFSSISSIGEKNIFFFFENITSKRSRSARLEPPLYPCVNGFQCPKTKKCAYIYNIHMII